VYVVSDHTVIFLCCAQVAVGDIVSPTASTVNNNSSSSQQYASDQHRTQQLVVGDSVGTVAVISVDGDVLWDVQLCGTVSLAPSLADVNRDGVLDVIVVTHSTLTVRGRSRVQSVVWALHGDSGSVVAGFPIVLPSSASHDVVVSAAVTVTDLSHSLTESDGDRVGDRTHLLIPSLDGIVYIVEVGDVLSGNTSGKSPLFLFTATIATLLSLLL
jgi:hypothetical protein